MPGPGKKSTALRAISGSHLPKLPPGIELPALTEVPDPPEWLTSVRGLAEWHRLAPILIANKLLTKGGLSTLGTLCSVHGAITDLFAVNDCPAAHTIAQYRALVNDFGLTPVAQGRVKPFVQETPANPFAEFAKRSA